MQVELSHREVAQLLAALRNWQVDALNEDMVEEFAGPLRGPRAAGRRRDRCPLRAAQLRWGAGREGRRLLSAGTAPGAPPLRGRLS